MLLPHGVSTTKGAFLLDAPGRCFCPTPTNKNLLYHCLLLMYVDTYIFIVQLDRMTFVKQFSVSIAKTTEDPIFL